MPGPNWSTDDPADTARIVANVTAALVDAAALAASRSTLSAADLQRWHRTVYAGCNVPSAAYVGAFRGQPHPHLIGYEVGVGVVLADGLPEKAGVWASDVGAEVSDFIQRLNTALGVLDGLVGVGAHPTTADVLGEVVEVTAIAQGEWVRIHPFANGNGRIARLLAGHIALRSGLPVFVTLKPRPADVAYARAAKASMGRPPDFRGDHTEATAVFGHLLALELLGP